MGFRESLKQGHEKVHRDVELRALRRAPETAEWITIKVTGTRELTTYSDRGWELVSSVPLGRGAGWTQYIMRKKRSQIILDNEVHGVVA